MTLLSSLSRLTHRRSKKLAPDVRLATSTRRLLDLIDPSLLATQSYLRKLHEPVSYALAYCDQLVDSLPEPITINQQAFASDPLVHALFSSAGDIVQMLGESQALREYLATPGNRLLQDDNELFALLATRRQTKRVFGAVDDGRNIVSDVAQEILYFTAHTLAEPDATQEGYRSRLQTAAFESLAKNFRAHIDGVRLQRKELQGERHLAQAHLTVLRGTLGSPQIEVHTRRIKEVDASLQEAFDSLMPDKIITALASYLRQPEQSLRLEPVSVAVDRAGVTYPNVTYPNVTDPSVTDTSAAPEHPAPSARFSRLDLSELISRDQRRNVVLPIRLRREDAEIAVSMVDDRKRRFLII